jgi:CheY-like chemotaxis protein
MLMASHDLQALHVLVLEGNHESRDLLRTALEECGAFVTTPASVERAKALLQAVRPDVLVADLAMLARGSAPPREVLAVVQQHGVRVPIIALSEVGRGTEPLAGDGFAEVVERPVDPTALCAIVQRHALKAYGVSIS